MFLQVHIIDWKQIMSECSHCMWSVTNPENLPANPPVKMLGGSFHGYHTKHWTIAHAKDGILGTLVRAEQMWCMFLTIVSILTKPNVSTHCIECEIPQNTHLVHPIRRAPDFAVWVGFQATEVRTPPFIFRCRIAHSHEAQYSCSCYFPANLSALMPETCFRQTAHRT